MYYFWSVPYDCISIPSISSWFIYYVSEVLYLLILFTYFTQLPPLLAITSLLCVSLLLSLSCWVVSDSLQPMDCSMPGFEVLHYSPEFAQLVSIEYLMSSNHLILCCLLLLLPTIFPRIRVFSNELALCIKWPKYWSFSFSISPSNEYSGWISFRIDWFDLLAVHQALKSFL